MKLKQIFRKAINILNTHGWCQRASTNRDGEHCMMQAIDIAIVPQPGEQTYVAYVALYNAARDKLREAVLKLEIDSNQKRIRDNAAIWAVSWNGKM